ncbi:hypothetical protein NQ318_017028 [Aromia moschata]|uniref:VWFC domain-containing protein n=1 Tax=Aromia moschata TaxID=1265417 RepID=A0AAV8XDJ3_9CUCU|nr:hypothetical protein NQ318_017028 [Aromia moschata]
MKKECVGHVEKRMGTRLRNANKTNKGLGGRGPGKLTIKMNSVVENSHSHETCLPEVVTLEQGSTAATLVKKIHILVALKEMEIIESNTSYKGHKSNRGKTSGMSLATRVHGPPGLRDNKTNNVFMISDPKNSPSNHLRFDSGRIRGKTSGMGLATRVPGPQVLSDLIREYHCDHLGTVMYEDINCAPVYEPNNTCPVKFECGDFSSHNETCVFRGRRYDVNEEVDEFITYENCYVACRCEHPESDTKYICAVLDCPEWLDPAIEEGCYRKYDLDKCCSTGTVCLTKEKVETCDFDGKIFHEGELYFPENTCTKCACQKGYNGTMEEPFCKRNLCSLQILHSDKLEKFCAPLYFHRDNGEALCCPNEWVCPAADEEIVTVNGNADANADLTCKFGSASLKLGEGFQKSVEFYGRERNVTCECVLPPLLTCKES